MTGILDALWGLLGLDSSRPKEKTIHDRCADLAEPWESYVGEIPGMTEELERILKTQSGSVSEGTGKLVELRGYSYELSWSLTGRGVTREWREATKEEHDAYQEWKKREGFLKKDDPTARDELEEFLSEHDVDFYTKTSSNSIYRTTLDVLSLLPATHLQSDRFKSLSLGRSCSPGVAGAENDNGEIIMAPYTLRCVRNYIAFLIHEIGHTFHDYIDENLSEGEKDMLISAHEVIRSDNTAFGIDYGYDIRHRRERQENLKEFMAETYLAYVTQGQKLRKWIDFTGEQGMISHSAWEIVYDVFKKGFDGLEYENGRQITPEAE